MKYYESTLHEMKVRTDAESNEAFIKGEGKERKVPVTNKVVNDAILEGNTISQEEYEK